MLEEGGYHPTESFTAGTGRALRTLYRDGGGGMAIGRPSVLYAEGRCVGGSTVVNGGMSWRTPARVLQRWAEQEGLRAIGERDLDPYFEAIESRLSVGEQDPETIGRDSELFRDAARARGWAVVPNRQEPAALRGHQQLQQRLPDRREAVDAGDQRAPGAGGRAPGCSPTSGWTALCWAAVPGAATGVTGHVVRPGGRRGPGLTVRARAVIVAGGAIQTPALLARSGLRPAVWPARPEPVGAPERGGDRVLRRGGGRLAGRAPGLPGARVHRRGAAAVRDQPHALHAGRHPARLRRRARRADGGLQPRRHRRAAGLRHRHRPDPVPARLRAAGLLPAHRARRRPRGARRRADRAGLVHGGRPAGAAPVRGRPGGP